MDDRLYLIGGVEKEKTKVCAEGIFVFTPGRTEMVANENGFFQKPSTACVHCNNTLLTQQLVEHGRN